MNKYVIVVLVFVVIYAFVGDQSLVHRIHRSFQIHRLERSIEKYEKGKQEAQRELEGLQNPDSLSRYAREHYYMHEKTEDVYIVPEK
ncbi:MAG: septum formation initiator family protein [Paludibacteraceae bacterium]|nr:septum formation initiator family protein [Paludibacteraceae bacterium]